jgi:alpha-tubulin suppressor-like RCC1 family protein
MKAWTALVVTAFLAVVVLSGTALAGWQPAGSNAGNSLSTGTWSSPMYAWGWGQDGRTGVLLLDTSSATAVRVTGIETWSAVAAGESATCGITTAGLLYCWGVNGSGQLGTGDTTYRYEPTQLPGSVVWSAVAMGQTHTCAIKAADSTLWCWGSNGEGQVGKGAKSAAVTAPTQVSTAGVTSWSSVSLGEVSSCGIKTDATLWCWGDNAWGQLGVGSVVDKTVPTQVGAATWSSVGLSFTSSCAVKAADASLWCWGYGNYGQLGNNSSADQHAPVAASGGGTWSAVAGGQDHSCGLRVNGTIWCWGNGSYGALANGSQSNALVPTQEVSGATTWTALTTMEFGSCARRSTGALYCWGRNNIGQLGDGSTTDRWVPTASGTDTAWTTHLAGGRDHFCVLRSDQALWCQGSDFDDQLGHNWNDKVSSPTPVLAPSGSWSTGSVGEEGGCGIQADSTLWCWGVNSHGAAGQGDTAIHPFPLKVGAATTWRSVSVGTTAVCAIRTDDSMWCWGNGATGQLGVAGASGDVMTPAAGPAGSWSAVSVGVGHTCGIKTNGTLWCWGSNSGGPLGTGSYTPKEETPQAVTATGVSTWASVTTGEDTSCAIAATGANAGSLYCWGWGWYGQIGNGTYDDQYSPVRVGAATWSYVAAGTWFTCGVRTNGTLWCWGNNQDGQLGIGGAPNNPPQVASPQQAGAAATWSGVAAGSGCGCAVRTDHTVWCWGDGASGQLGDRGTATVTSPQQVPGLTASWVEAHGGASVTLAG